LLIVVDRYPFGGLKVQGNGFYGTNCEAYYDDNCYQKIGETGNTYKAREIEPRKRKKPSDTGSNPIPGQSGADPQCHNFANGGGAKSMKCWFKC